MTLHSELRFDHATLGYAHNQLDRLANARDHESIIPALMADPSARAYAFSGDRVLLRSGEEDADPRFTLHERQGFGEPTDTVFLGRSDEGGTFAVRFDPPAEESEGTPNTEDLRSMATSGATAPEVLGILAEAKALLHWHRSHQLLRHLRTSVRTWSPGAGAGNCPSVRDRRIFPGRIPW